MKSSGKILISNST